MNELTNPTFYREIKYNPCKLTFNDYKNKQRILQHPMITIIAF